MTLLFLGLGGAELILISIILIPFFIIPIASYWKIFEKAEQPGWAALIPIYNLIILMKIINKPWWWALLCIIPYLGIIWIIWSNNLMVKRFGKTERQKLNGIEWTGGTFRARVYPARYPVQTGNH